MMYDLAKYLVCVLLLAVCCAAQTANTQAANDVSNETAQLPATQGISTEGQNLAIAYGLPMSDPTGLMVGQDSSSQTTTSKPSGQTTTTTQTTSGQTTTTTKPSGQKTTTVHATASTNEPAWDWATGVSIGIAYSYTTGSPGLGSFNLGAGYRWKRQFEVTTDMDFGTQTIDLSPVFSKSKRQNYLFGGRYYIARALGKHSRFEPFGHLMYGVSHQSINTQVGVPVTSEISTAQTSWAWDFGGGVDYLLSKHWALRGRADWLRTHYNSQAQSHFKWVAGFWYSFTARKLPQ